VFQPDWTQLEYNDALPVTICLHMKHYDLWAVIWTLNIMHVLIMQHTFLHSWWWMVHLDKLSLCMHLRQERPWMAYNIRKSDYWIIFLSSQQWSLMQLKKFLTVELLVVKVHYSLSAEVIITVPHLLKSGKLARLPLISLFGLTNVRSTRLNSKLWFSVHCYFSWHGLI